MLEAEMFGGIAVLDVNIDCEIQMKHRFLKLPYLIVDISLDLFYHFQLLLRKETGVCKTALRTWACKSGHSDYGVVQRNTLWGRS